jgi:hypothetical protein
VFLIPTIKYYMLQVGAHLNTGMPDNPLTAVAVASLTDVIKGLLKAVVDANITDGGCKKKKLKVMNPEKEAKGYESSPVPDTIYCHFSPRNLFFLSFLISMDSKSLSPAMCYNSLSHNFSQFL